MDKKVYRQWIGEPSMTRTTSTRRTLAAEVLASSHGHGDGGKKRKIDPQETALLQRMTLRAKLKYSPRPDEVALLVPHKNLMKKIERKIILPEPLTGFKDHQRRLTILIRGRSSKDDITSFASGESHEEEEETKEIAPKQTVLRYAASVGGRTSMMQRKGSYGGYHHSQMGIRIPTQHLPPSVTDHLALLERLQAAKEFTFVYLCYAVPKSSEFFHPYLFKEVSFDQTDGLNYSTASTEGITQYAPTEAIFTPLDKWTLNYKLFMQVVKIPTFEKYRMWKGFKVWQKAVVWQKFIYAQRVLSSSLFIMDKDLGNAILEVKKNAFEISRMSFVDRSVTEKNQFFYFMEDQYLKYEELRDKLKKFRLDAVDVINKAMHASLWTRGFTTDDRNFAPMDESAVKKRSMRSDSMSFIQRANKRRYCIRLSSFLKMCDYHMISLLGNILGRSYAYLWEMFKSHYDLLPSDEILDDIAVGIDIEEPRPEGSPQSPMFVINLGMSPEAVTLDPSEEIMKHHINQLIEMWENCCFNFVRFVDDPFFKPFTEPVIMGKQLEKICGPASNLKEILDGNEVHLETISKLHQVFEDSFVKAKRYFQRFDTMRILYSEDLLTPERILTEEKNLKVIKVLVERYVNEIDFIDTIISQIFVGLFLFNQEPMKEETLPAPKKLLEIFHVCLPLIGKEKVTYIQEQCAEIQERLTFEPVEVTEFVDYLEYLEKCYDLCEELERTMDYCKELYDLMDENEIFPPPEDHNDYLNVAVDMGQARTLVDEKLDGRGKLTDAFNAKLDKDIGILIANAADVRDEAMRPWLIDSATDPEKAKETLNVLLETQLGFQERALEFRNFQKAFKVEITRFDILEEVTSEVRLRLLLWDSLESWKNTMADWYTSDFTTLDPEEMNNTTTKMQKNVTLLEKGLPKNNKLVLRLADNVEVFREKLPIVGYLRNPNLKPRHWLTIENILGRKFILGEVLTLQQLEDAGLFQWQDELMEVSSQASSEAGLELLLKKVELAWKEQELTILPHKDAKDVWIMGGLEELQTVLDESNININTIAASRHVGPIKPRVDEWVRLLDLFSTTLDEWMSCQQTWMYLEAIFSAPDIQRQLPAESKMFLIVDKSWKDIMRTTQKTPLAMPAVTAPGVLETFLKNNALLSQITKCLEAYLEVKRVGFPRFYFLSNDELLEILAQTKNPFAVQPHLRKCFDAIAKLEFGFKITESGEDAPPERIMTTDIIAMLSPEDERVVLGKGLKARGSVEDWLGKVEENMFSSLQRCMKRALADYDERPRNDWLKLHANQIVLTVSQIMWARKVHHILENPATVSQALLTFEKVNVDSLTSMAAMARSDITKLFRKVLCAMITVDVHARDTISNMIEANVQSPNDFEWLKMIRYYWVISTETVQARMASANLPYGYEYLGASGVLVITPLTDRCYLCLMGALQMDLGGAPAGPAGTGKTETTKDLAKALAVQCVVFNCSEGLDYKMMGRFFSGLAQSGAWCCFDEFNRIDIEVLSVIAQQLVTIRNAKASGAARFMFEGREIKMVRSCAAFITMNPGYAGRTELPDNLKALFRPIAMMVPDYALIAEVILYSEGFESSKPLAQKMVQMYKLCSEQLSQQDHYDFGMRAVKSVLVMAGALKRAAPDQREDITLICALRDSNLPKFLSDDSDLFQGILGDLFPGVKLPEPEIGDLQETIEEILIENGHQAKETVITKVIQLHETMVVRWGVMLVGPTGGGKTVVLHTLGDALTRLFEKQVDDLNYRPVVKQTMNPKAIHIDELYGAVNNMTMEWRDGLLGLAVRSACACHAEVHQWIINDGPVDALWIENLNTVLDDNKMLCLANSERIKLTPWVHMLFEVMDLSQASPATVSRCGMVYIDPEDLGWLPYVQSWMARLPSDMLLQENRELLEELFEVYLVKIINFANKNCDYAIHQVEISKVTMLCNLMETLLRLAGPGQGIGQPGGDKIRARSFVTQCFVWSTLWAVGGNLLFYSRERIETFIQDKFDEHLDARLPMGGDLWDLYMNTTERRFELWEKIVEPYEYNNETPFFEMLVPTSDTARFGHVAGLLLDMRQPVMFTGDTGVGKSVIAKQVLGRLSTESNCIPVVLNFSAQTTSLRTQEMIEIRLEKRTKNTVGAPLGKYIVVFVDDINMPKLETYGAQPPVELLRQFLDYKGLFDRDKFFWKNITDVVLSCACAPPGGGRNPLTPRFVRHFSMLLIPPPSEMSLKVIFRSILKGFLVDFLPPVRDLAEQLVTVSVEIYQRIAEELLPTPSKSHYVFNLRDLSKCIQGVLQASNTSVRDARAMQRLFYHESLRVFHDRLINDEDKLYYNEMMDEVCSRTFGTHILQEGELLLYGDFMIMSEPKEQRQYEEITDVVKLKKVLNDYLEDYNANYGKDMKIIMFMDAVEHVIRLARLLRAERGNGLLIGVSGMGKQSLTKLGAHLNGYKCAQIELMRGYDHDAFHEDLRKFYWSAGAMNEPTVFLFTDNQIIHEEFLEDINNMLNSGEVPNLFESDEYEKVIIACRQLAMDSGIHDVTRDAIFNFFIARVRSNLHLVICMSPVGDAFRRRCRMFPSLVNCCTIDWFIKWPTEALQSVAESSLEDMGDAKMVHNMASVCVIMHASVEEASEKYYDEARRRYYTTPSSYLELLRLYKDLLAQRTERVKYKRDRIATGLSKINETNDLVSSMKEDLKVLEPILADKAVSLGELMVQLEKEQIQGDKVREIVTADEAIAKEKAAETQILADDAQRDLDSALPALEAAQDALRSLNKKDTDELRVFQKPPQLVQFVMESVCLLLGAKQDWASAKQQLGDTNFLKRLQEFDKDHIPEKTIAKLKTYVSHKDFTPPIVAKVSKVAKSMCIWVIAIDIYAKVFKEVEPKRKKQQAAEAEMQQVMNVLKEKQRQLAEVEAYIQGLQDQLQAGLEEQMQLEASIDLCASRLNRSGRLTSALSDEEVRWALTVKTLAKEMNEMPGNVLVAAACVAYLGAFTNEYRVRLVSEWMENCRQRKIPSSKQDVNLVTVLGDPNDIRVWNMFGLPRDPVSTENAIMMTQAGRWPLIIDPQEQANRWIRNMEKANNIIITKMTDPNLLRIMESAIRTGAPVLIEEVGEFLDPTLGPILNRQTFTQAGRVLIRLGDSDVDYDRHFKLYMTTKLPNPHYLPEVCIMVTLINFTVTPSGLEEQLLAEVVGLEQPQLEAQRTDLIMRISKDKNQLQALEDRVLKLLFTSEGCILDDEELVETLNESKETSGIIAARLIEAETTEVKITAAREKYRTLAARGSVLYFVVAQLQDIDPMYQFSLKYFTQIFVTVIQTTEKCPDLEERLNKLMNAEILSMYSNVSRGLFERHKVLYSFLLAAAVETQCGRLTAKQYSFLLRGPSGSRPSIYHDAKPDAAGLTEPMFSAVVHLQMEIPQFENLINDVLNDITITLGDFTQVIRLKGGTRQRSSVDWNYELTPFNKLLMLKALQEEKLVFAIGAFVRVTLGKVFTDSPAVSLPVLYADMNSSTPLVFVLSSGSDPMAPLQRFAADVGMTARLESISLGQGQGPVAEALLDRGRNQGLWVFLQNCHLAKSWMPALEVIVRNLALGIGQTHKDFRMFMSSMPSEVFPVSVLQNSVKVTNEPPRGIRANVSRALSDITPEVFEDNHLGQQWRAMVFGLTLFHAIILERRKFGPLGWNITYEFSDSDRECALHVLQMFCKSSHKIPWDALEYITGEITYGGRVTDSWDQRCLKTILKKFFSPETIVPRYKYSPEGTYYCPAFKTLKKFQEFASALPILETPEVFGMHENANLAYQINETQSMLNTLLEGQPMRGGGGAVDTDEVVYDLAQNVMDRIVKDVGRNDPHITLTHLDPRGRLPSLTTVLVQELDRFNKLLSLLHDSLINLQKAIRGFVVMSEQLEGVYTAFVNNQVPKLWGSKSYPSLKCLSSWVHDLELRLDFVQTWHGLGQPASFWLSGFFFPQGFMTGALQTHARKHNLPIDKLTFDFNVLPAFIYQEKVYQAHLDGVRDNPALYNNVQPPSNGVILHGLFLDAGYWDNRTMMLTDALPGVMTPALPALHLEPTLTIVPSNRYMTPLYKTSARAGVLSTTGHSTNFVVTVLLPSSKPQSYWIMQGTALLTQTTD